MTCIVGLTDGQTCWLGGDSAVVTGQAVRLTADQKVFTNGPYAFGVCGSPRMGQLLHYALTPPPPPAGEALQGFLVSEFAAAVRSCFKNGGWARKNDEQEQGGNFIFATQGRLFEMYSDYQVLEYQTPYIATGCGEYYAIGSLYSTDPENRADSYMWRTRLTEEQRLELALAAAAEFSTSVRPPFRYTHVTAGVALAEVPA